MQWYYSINNEQQGPVDESDLTALAKQGVVHPQTLVWREGMADWQPYQTLFGGGGAGTGDMVTCPSCGAMTQSNQLIPLANNQVVCPQCSKGYSQRLIEGADGTFDGEFEYAGFLLRAGGTLIDGIILQVVQFVIQIIGMMAMGGADPNDPMNPVMLGIMLINVIIGFGYPIFFLGGKYQATPGMMICKIRIIMEDGSNVSHLRVFGRIFASILSSLTLGIGYLMVLWDPEKRTLHDVICHTRVIKK